MSWSAGGSLRTRAGVMRYNSSAEQGQVFVWGEYNQNNQLKSVCYTDPLLIQCDKAISVFCGSGFVTILSGMNVITLPSLSPDSLRSRPLLLCARCASQLLIRLESSDVAQFGFAGSVGNAPSFKASRACEILKKRKIVAISANQQEAIAMSAYQPPC